MSDNVCQTIEHWARPEHMYLLANPFKSWKLYDATTHDLISKFRVLQQSVFVRFVLIEEQFAVI